ncbi:LptF/LptG family permease [Devosia sp. CAU 1758]
MSVATKVLSGVLGDTRHIRYVVSLYVTRTIFFVLIALAIVLTLDAATHLSRIVEQQAEMAQPSWAVSGYYLGLRALYVLPSLLPVAAFAGPLWAEHSLATSLERLMISNSGRSRFQTLLPALVFGTLIGLAQFYLLAEVRPAVSQAQGEARFRYFGPYYQTPHVGEATWIALGDEMMRARIRFEPERVMLEEVQLFQIADTSSVALVSVAQSAVPERNGIWALHEGALWNTTENSGRAQAMTAAPYTILRRPLNLDPIWLTHSRVPPDLMPHDLLARFAYNPIIPRNFVYQAALHHRYAAVPGAIGMALLAGALAMTLFGPRTAPRQVLICAIIGGTAYVFLLAIPMVGASGAAPAGVAAWAVPIVLNVTALISVGWPEPQRRSSVPAAD